MAKVNIELVEGPRVADVSREIAEAQLKSHPAFPKNASFKLDEIKGQWIAAIVQAGPGPFGAPADSEEESPAPKSEGPDDTAPESPDSESPDEGGDEGEEKGPPKDKKEKGGGSEELHKIFDLLNQVAVALGIPDTMGPDASPVPGGDEGAPPAPPGPPAGPEGAGGEHDKVDHLKALKPGEAPPGTTPVGAPAFSHAIPDGHPWKEYVGVTSSFTVEEPIGDTPLAQVRAELNHLARTSGFKVKQLREGRDEDGRRTAAAMISVY